MTVWRKVKLGDCCDITSSKRIFYNEYVESGVPFYRSKEIIEKAKGDTISTPLYISHARFEEIKESFGAPQKKDLLLTAVGSLGIPYLINDSNPFYFKDGNLIWFKSFNDDLNSEFLYYWFKTRSAFQMLDKIAIGSAQKALTISSVKQISIEIPTRDIQDRIVKVLSRYDALIENYQRQIKLLEEAAQRLYKEWFVDLRFPGHQSTPIINNLPQSWQKKRITDILDIKYGKDHKKLKDGPIPVYGTGGIMRYADSCLYCGESVLIPRKGSLNNIMLVNGSFWTIDTMFYSIPKIENAAKIAYFYLKDLDMYSFNIGAAVPSMTINILSGMEISLPTDEIRHEFECTVDNYYQQIALLENQIRTLSEARDRLLPKLMTGEIEV